MPHARYSLPRPPAPLAAALALAASLFAAPLSAQEQELDVPYVPTPMNVVEQMLELVEPTAEDSLYDLGSGDGRIVIRAASRYGTPGVGVELDPSRVATARTAARDSGVADRVRFVQGDLFEANIRPATIVTLYLLTSVNRRLRPKLFRELRPGTRLVSHDFDMGEWRADSVVVMPEESSTVYYWVMPAHLAGTWQVSTPSHGELRLQIEQKFQEIRAGASRPAGGVAVREARMTGDSVSFSLVGFGGGDEASLDLSGTVEGDRMSGRTGDGEWTATRVSGGDRPIDEWSAAASGAPRRPRR